MYYKRNSKKNSFFVKNAQRKDVVIQRELSWKAGTYSSVIDKMRVKRLNSGGSMTLKDIANMAGVSVATVSYVLNNKDNKVSTEVAARVRSIMEQVNYQPNTMAKSLRSSKSKIIGILTEDMSVWQASYIVQGITHYAEANGYSVMISDLAMKSKIQSRYDDIYQYRKLINTAVSKLRGLQVGGIIFLGMHDRSVNGLIQTDVPVVYAYCSTSQTEDVQVRYDNQEISRQTVSMLLKRFGEAVGIIDGPIQSTPARLRMAGVEEAYAQAGISMNLNLRGSGNWEYESGRKACRAMLDSGYPLKAIYALNDLMALGAIREIQSRGLKVPEDIQIVGFDDMSLSEYANPSLTTVNVPLEEIGYEAAAALADLLEKGKTEKNQICLDCRMVWRESCPPPVE